MQTMIVILALFVATAAQAEERTLTKLECAKAVLIINRLAAQLDVSAENATFSFSDAFKPGGLAGELQDKVERVDATGATALLAMGEYVKALRDFGAALQRCAKGEQQGRE